MDKLLKLINEYDDTTWDVVEESDQDSEEQPVWTEHNWHLRFNNANMVQFPDDMFDHYAISKSYWFIDWLVENSKVYVTDLYNKENIDLMDKLAHLWLKWSEILAMYLSLQKNPIKTLISILV